jgi:hypothetical protein
MVRGGARGSSSQRYLRVGLGYKGSLALLLAKQVERDSLAGLPGASGRAARVGHRTAMPDCAVRNSSSARQRPSAMSVRTLCPSPVPQLDLGAVLDGEKTRAVVLQLEDPVVGREG